MLKKLVLGLCLAVTLVAGTELFHPDHVRLFNSFLSGDAASKSELLSMLGRGEINRAIAEYRGQMDEVNRLLALLENQPVQKDQGTLEKIQDAASLSRQIAGDAPLKVTLKEAMDMVIGGGAYTLDRESWKRLKRGLLSTLKKHKFVKRRLAQREVITIEMTDAVLRKDLTLDQIEASEQAYLVGDVKDTVLLMKRVHREVSFQMDVSPPLEIILGWAGRQRTRRIQGGKLARLTVEKLCEEFGRMNVFKACMHIDREWQRASSEVRSFAARFVLDNLMSRFSRVKDMDAVIGKLHLSESDRTRIFREMIDVANQKVFSRDHAQVLLTMYGQYSAEALSYMLGKERQYNLKLAASEHALAAVRGESDSMFLSPLGATAEELEGIMKDENLMRRIGTDAARVLKVRLAVLQWQDGSAAEVSTAAKTADAFPEFVEFTFDSIAMTNPELLHPDALANHLLLSDESSSCAKFETAPSRTRVVVLQKYADLVKSPSSKGLKLEGISDAVEFWRLVDSAKKALTQCKWTSSSAWTLHLWSYDVKPMFEARVNEEHVKAACKELGLFHDLELISVHPKLYDYVHYVNKHSELPEALART